MKRILSMLMILVLCAALMSACGASEPSSVAVPSSSEISAQAVSPAPPVEEAPTEKPVMRVAALKGATTMGMVQLIENGESGEAANEYAFSIGTIDETVPMLAKGEIDAAALPANLASVIYNNTNGAYQVAAINTLGVMYVLEKGDTISSVEDLRGKTIYSIGKGAVPEFAVNYVLNQRGIDPASDVELEYKSEAAEILPLLMQQESAIAVLQQPFVTNALARVEGLRVVLDWSEEWDAVAGGKSELITGVVVVRREFAEQNPEDVSRFLEEYKESVAFVNSQPAEASVLIEKYGIVAAEIAEKAIPASNIVFVDGENAKSSLIGYLEVLFEQNPQSVGGTLPDDDFYYLQ